MSQIKHILDSVKKYTRKESAFPWLLDICCTLQTHLIFDKNGRNTETQVVRTITSFFTDITMIFSSQISFQSCYFRFVYTDACCMTERAELCYDSANSVHYHNLSYIMHGNKMKKKKKVFCISYMHAKTLPEVNNFG